MDQQGDHSAEAKRVLANIAKARKWRSHFAPVYNTFYDLAAPERLRVDNQISGQTPRAPSDQDAIFDGTLQQAVQDYASDFADEFTPEYRAWTKHEASKKVPKPFQKQVEDYIAQRQEIVFGAIRQSSYVEASNDAYVDSAIGPFAVQVRPTRPGRPIDVEYVPLRELLILPGPFGNVGHRYRERSIPIADLDFVYPDCDWSEVAPTREERAKRQGEETVIEGGYRDWTKSEESWCWFVIARGKVKKKLTFKGRGSCPLIVGRIGVSHPSAYGLGPGSRAIAAARSLNELSYLELRRIGKIVDPPGVFTDPTGMFNPDAGLDAGYIYEAGEGFNWTDLAPQGDQRETFMKHEELRMAILRALYQDKPYQRGQTPPSATQWAGEQAAMEKRKALPRGRIHSEWVIPLIERFEWVLAFRGELEPLQIEGDMIEVRPISPLSKAADLEDAQLALQFMDAMRMSGEPLGAMVNTQETYSNLQKKYGDGVVKLLTAEQRQEMLQRTELSGQAVG